MGVREHSLTLRGDAPTLYEERDASERATKNAQSPGSTDAGGAKLLLRTDHLWEAEQRWKNGSRVDL